MLKLLRTLPKVLKYLPSDKAQDARSFMMSFQYWLGGSPDNIESMLLMLANTYVDNVRAGPGIQVRVRRHPYLLLYGCGWEILHWMASTYQQQR